MSILATVRYCYADIMESRGAGSELGFFDRWRSVRRLTIFSVRIYTRDASRGFGCAHRYPSVSVTYAQVYVALKCTRAVFGS